MIIQSVVVGGMSLKGLGIRQANCVGHAFDNFLT